MDKKTNLIEKTLISEEKTIQLVIANLKEQNFGAPISQVLEVIHHIHITPIPDSPSFIAGIANVHSKMVLIIDLARYFGFDDKPNKTAKHIIIIRHNKELYGLLVDEVSQIIRVPESAIKTSPELIHQINKNYISGVYVASEDSLVLIFDLEKILSEQELMMSSQDSNDTLDATDFATLSTKSK